MLKQIEIDGFKSIRRATIGLNPVNVLIGPNGAGKSNFIGFFKLLNWMMSNSLQRFVGEAGGASSLLHYGPKTTPQISSTLTIETERGVNEYSMRLAHAAGDTLIFTDEQIAYRPSGGHSPSQRSLGAGHKETKLNEEADRGDPMARAVRWELNRCRVLHFHDTSDTARIRQYSPVDRSQYLLSDGGNLAAMLYRIKREHRDHYDRIVAVIQQIAPFFLDFSFPLEEEAPRSVLLRWKQREPHTDYDLGPHQLSDGTLRAIALITLFLQPREYMPRAIILDEPELGLHPYAIEVVASLARQAAEHTQVILATQSPALLDQFEPEDVIVVDYEKGESRLRRLDAKGLEAWLGEYTLSELWNKNVLGGRPGR